jgi:hypothetical protein
MVNAEVFIESARASDSNNSSTIFTYKIGDKYDDSYTIRNLALFTLGKAAGDEATIKALYDDNA